MGVSWQCKTWESFSNCFFKRGNVSGNGNYTIGIKRNGKLEKVIYMLDSNGCYNCKSYSYIENYPEYNQNEKVIKEEGIFADQIDWIESSCKSIGKCIGKMACAHIPPYAFNKAIYEKGYVTKLTDYSIENFVLGKDKVAKDNDFGSKNEPVRGYESERLWKVFKANNFTHMFVGHQHTNNCSIDCDGVIVTFGIKTGTYDYHNKIGGTLITLNNKKETKIKHLYLKELENNISYK